MPSARGPVSDNSKVMVLEGIKLIYYVAMETAGSIPFIYTSKFFIVGIVSFKDD